MNNNKSTNNCPHKYEENKPFHQMAKVVAFRDKSGQDEKEKTPYGATTNHESFGAFTCGNGFW